MFHLPRLVSRSTTAQTVATRRERERERKRLPLFFFFPLPFHKVNSSFSTLVHCIYRLLIKPLNELSWWRIGKRESSFPPFVSIRFTFHIDARSSSRKPSPKERIQLPRASRIENRARMTWQRTPSSLFRFFLRFSMGPGEQKPSISRFIQLLTEEAISWISHITRLHSLTCNRKGIDHSLKGGTKLYDASSSEFCQYLLAK